LVTRSRTKRRREGAEGLICGEQSAKTRGGNAPLGERRRPFTLKKNPKKRIKKKKEHEKPRRVDSLDKPKIQEGETPSIEPRGKKICEAEGALLYRTTHPSVGKELGGGRKRFHRLVFGHGKKKVGGGGMEISLVVGGPADVTGVSGGRGNGSGEILEGEGLGWGSAECSRKKSSSDLAGGGLTERKVEKTEKGVCGSHFCVVMTGLTARRAGRS